MSTQYQLDAKTILDKQFHVDLKGYNPQEVDEFLDMVISDYQAYDQTLQDFCGHFMPPHRTAAIQTAP